MQLFLDNILAQSLLSNEVSFACLRCIFHRTSRPCTHMALTHARSSGNAEIAVC